MTDLTTRVKYEHYTARNSSCKRSTISFILIKRKLFMAVSLFTLIATSSSAQFQPLIDLSQSHADVTIYGAHSGDHISLGLTTGDFDGDGLSDLAILSAGSLVDSAGAFIHIFWARSSQDTLIDLLYYQGDVSKILAPPGEDGFLSARILSGDFNNDGCDDIALGLPQESLYLNFDGKVYIIFGSPVFPDTLELWHPSSSVTTVWPIPGSSSWLGNMLATGDVNGDTYTDLIIGAPAINPGGQVYVIYGRESFPPNIYLGATQPSLTRIIEYYQKQATGTGLACKDVNNDGFDDLLIGSPGNASGFYRGRATLLYGSNSLPDSIVLSSATIHAMGMKRFYGEYTHGYLGWRVAIADINGDETQDLILSALMADPLGCDNCGEIYIVPWVPDMPDSVSIGANDIIMMRLIGSGVLQYYGQEIIAADITDNGLEDIMIMSRPDRYDPSDVGKVTVVYGVSDFPDTVFLGTDPTVTRFLAEGRQDDFGRGLGAGDVNNDGIIDALIGANGAFPLGRGAAGIAYIFYGVAETTGVRPEPVPELALLRNYPNPFSTSTKIEYSIDRPIPVTLKIYNVLGQRIYQIVNPTTALDVNSFEWRGLDGHGRSVASGLYLFKIEAAGVARFGKTTLLR